MDSDLAKNWQQNNAVLWSQDHKFFLARPFPKDLTLFEINVIMSSHKLHINSLLKGWVIQFLCKYHMYH